MTVFKIKVGRFAALLCVLALGGCLQPQETELYTLSSLPPPKETSEKPLKLAINKISMPAYLNRLEMVTRESDTKLVAGHSTQWAEPLDVTFQRVLSENLSSKLGTNDVVSLPTDRNIPVDNQVDVEVTRFDADAEGNVVLDARWRIFDGTGEKLVATGRTRVNEKYEGDSEQAAAAMSNCLAAVTGRIALALTEPLQQQSTPIPTGSLVVATP
ncbi:MAG: membrane integrity-associated transporter subunit PqiC [Geminicoccaceae bacterium]